MRSWRKKKCNENILYEKKMFFNTKVKEIKKKIFKYRISDYSEPTKTLINLLNISYF